MKKQVGDKVRFVGPNNNIAQIYEYEKRVGGKDLIIEAIEECPCNDERMDCLKFEGIDDGKYAWFRAGFFEIIERKKEN